MTETRPGGGAPAEKKHGLFWIISGWLAVAGGLVVALLWVATSEEPGRYYTMLLLFISPVALAAALPWKAAPPRFAGITCIVLEVIRGLLTFVYTRAERTPLAAESFSYFALAVACLTLPAVLVVVRVTTANESAQRAIRGHFFVTICAALYLFAHVGYQLTFALALHDRRGPAKALRASQPPHDQKQYVLVFNEGGASVDTSAQLAEVIEDEDWPSAPQDQHVLIARRYPEPDEVASVRWNVNQWKQIHALIDRSKSQAWRVTIIGHASDAIVDKDGATKNLSLSRVRMEQTHEALKPKLQDKRVEWVLRAVSNDDDIVAREFLDGRNHKLSVEVLLEHQRDFELLDYAYFMIYTITTTGYGDLMPSTPRAKFISSVANIFELFFIVVLFNLVLSYGNRQERESGKVAAPGAPTTAASGTAAPTPPPPLPQRQ